MLLEEATNFLLSYLNYGNFEGSAGANQLVVRRLTLAKSMLSIAWEAKDKDKVQTISKLYAEGEGLKTILDRLLLWLFLNERSTADEKAAEGYLPVSAKTPATIKVKEITDLINPMLMFVSDSEKNTAAIKTALTSLLSIVRGMN